MATDMGVRPFEAPRKTLASVVAAHDHRARYNGRYAQTPQQFAQGGELGRRITGDSLDFRPNAERYECGEDGQYLLDLPR